MLEKEPFRSKPGEGLICTLSVVCKTPSSIFLKVQQALFSILAFFWREAGVEHEARVTDAPIARVSRFALALPSPV